MPARTSPTPDAARDQLLRLGASLRAAREGQGVSAVAASQAAHISRMTLHRIERGEGNVAVTSWAAVASALGLTLEAAAPRAENPKAASVPKSISLGKYPQLRELAWQLGSVKRLTPRQALELYERNWRHLDRSKLSTAESELIRTLSEALSGGKLLV